MSLLQRLTLLVIAAIIPILLVEVSNQVHLRDERLSAIHRETELLSRNFNKEYDLMIQNIEQTLGALAQNASLRERDMAACQGVVEQLHKIYPSYLELTVIDENGTVQCSTLTNTLGTSIANRPHLRLAQENNTFSVGELTFLFDTNKPAQFFALPYRDKLDHPAGFITAQVDLSWLQDYVTDKTLPAGTAITIADRQGIVLARFPEIPGATGELLPEAYLPLLIKPERGEIELKGLDGLDRVQNYLPPDAGRWGLFTMVGFDKIAALAPIDEAMSRSLWGLAATALLSLLAVGWVAHRYIRAPVQTLIKVAERWRHGDYAARANLKNGHEGLVALGKAFNSMAESLQSYDRQRDEAHAARLKVADVFDSITDSVFEVDRDWCITFMNERARIDMAKGQDQVGLDLREAYPGIEDTSFWEVYTRAMAERVPIEFEDYYQPDRKWLCVRVFPSREGLAFYLQDVTGRHRLQKDLERQRALLETIIEGTPDPIFTKDREGRYLSANSATARVIGLERSAVIGKTDSDIFPARIAEALQDRDIRVMLSGEAEVSEEEVPDRHFGSDRIFLETRTPLRDADGVVIGIIGIARDITERKAAEDKLSQAKDEAERANLAKSKFLAAASHDLRQPLQSLILFTAALNSQVHTARGRQALEHLENGLEALKSLLDSLLDVSKLDAGVVNPEISAFPIAPVLDEIAASYAPVAAQKHLGWCVEHCTGTVRSDPTLLARLIRNLVDNAVRYTSQGSIKIHCHQGGDQLYIAVEDTGIGIPPEQTALIFEEFHQIGNTSRDRTQGLGLGLAIVRRIATLLGIHITVESKIGKGSSFSFLVPFATHEEHGLAALPISPDPDPDGRGRLLVVVDDDIMVLSSLEAILSDWNYEVIGVSSSEEALSILGKQHRCPDLVISDYRLYDGQTGTDAIMNIQAMFSRTMIASSDHHLERMIVTREDGEAVWAERRLDQAAWAVVRPVRSAFQFHGSRQSS